MADNWRSKLITGGVARSPNRAMLRAVGFGDGDFEKAIVGVANGHSTMNPCNAGIQPLVDRAMAALKAAGAMPQVFGVPTVTDGIGMGTEGMKYSLVSREVIADAIETSVNGQCMDGVLVVDYPPEECEEFAADMRAMAEPVLATNLEGLPARLDALLGALPDAAPIPAIVTLATPAAATCVAAASRIRSTLA